MTEKFLSRIKGKMFARPMNASGASDSITLPFTLPEGNDAIRAPHILDGSSGSVGYLTGQLLVATPLITGSCFHKSVVYVFQHNDEGAMGLLVNQPLERVRFGTLLEGKSEAIDANQHIHVYFGGPLEKTRGFVLHTSEYFEEFSLVRNGSVAVTASSSILSDMASGKGPRQSMLCVGYAGWQSGQLETEIAENSWLTVPATLPLLFSTEDELKWATSGKSLGVDMSLYSTTTGHA